MPISLYEVYAEWCIANTEYKRNNVELILSIRRNEVQLILRMYMSFAVIQASGVTAVTVVAGFLL